jgi:glycosyltransferase involved in cell wall biosynthesis
MRLPLSVVIPTLNEASNISSCIQSVQPISDEIVVMDNFSTDGTTEIARELNARVFQRPFDNYSINKNAAIEKTSHDWVLMLDADERVPTDLQTEIKEALNSQKADAFRIKRNTYFRGKKVRCWSGKAVTRLFRKNKASYDPKKLVHEELIVNGGRVETLDHPMDHYTFSSFEQYLPKVHSYTSLAAHEAYDKGMRASIFSLLMVPPVRFAKTYFVKGGILDGVPGVIIASLSAYSVFLKLSKLWELQNSR